ncbi:MAG: CHAD domain-containing protein [Mycobacteriales bacterium]
MASEQAGHGTPNHRLTVRGDDPLAEILAALGDRGTVEADAVHRSRATWLDTPDGRLAGAGIALRHERARGRSRLVLTGSAGPVDADGPVARWPALAHDVLPNRPEWAAIRSLVHPRALVEIASGRVESRPVRLLDEHRKTVARGVLETAPGFDGAALAFRLAPLRGYAAETDALVMLLARAEPITVRAAEPLPGGVARSPAARDIGGEKDAASAVAATLLNWLDIIVEAGPGVADDIDTEFLHDFRVAVRRSRSMVKLAGEVLPEKVVASLAPELRRLGDLTTPTRDLDVFLLGLQMGDNAIDADDPLLAPVVTELRRRRGVEFRKLRRHVRGTAYRDFTTSWRDALETVPATPERTVEQLAVSRIDRSYRKVRKRGGAITPKSPVEDLHDLRKRCKELRYLLDAFKPVLDPASYTPALRGLKDLQECLGRLQDAHVQSQLIHQTAADLISDTDVSAPTMLALGAATTGLDEQERAVRAEFEQNWQRFRRPVVRRAMADLTGGNATKLLA